MERILALYPESSRPSIALSLLDPDMQSIRAESLPQVELLFDSLKLFRRQRALADAQRDSARRETFLEQRRHPLLVTIVLLDSLRDTIAAAVVVRRPGFTPQDVIAISARKLSEGALREAVQQLWRLHLTSDPGAIQPALIAIRQVPVVRPWRDLGNSGSDRDVVGALLFSDKRDIEGIGRGRALVVTISPP